MILEPLREKNKEVLINSRAINKIQMAFLKGNLIFRDSQIT